MQNKESLSAQLLAKLVVEEVFAKVVEIAAHAHIHTLTFGEATLCAEAILTDDELEHSLIAVHTSAGSNLLSRASTKAGVYVSIKVLHCNSKSKLNTNLTHV